MCQFFSSTGANRVT